jgi:2-haloalkanoic acid dehalogenase type II
MRPDDYDAITFDVYGTLIDWEPMILMRLRAWADRHGASPSDAALIEAFDRARAHYQTLSPARPYPRILELSIAYVAGEWGGRPDPEEQQAFGASVAEWPAYPDSVAALARLKQRFVLGALTNMDDTSFAHSAKRLGEPFEMVVSADRAGAYKPSLRHFVLSLTDLAARGIPPHRVLHVAQSRRADVRPCNLLGQTVVHIDRPGKALGHTGFGAELALPDARFETMAAFVETLLS